MDFSTATIINNRKMKLEGKDYIVLKMTMLTEGVFAGSNGPLLYESNELSRLPAAWNGRPVTINHPTHNGQNISANHPEIVDKVRVGSIYNCFWDNQNKKLKAEAWIDSDRLQKLNASLWAKVTSNQIVEVSTGLFSDNEATAGVHNGKEYSGIARNFSPDHLALLTDSPGACSVNDGCGLNINNGNAMSDYQKQLADEVANWPLKSLPPMSKDAVAAMNEWEKSQGKMVTNCGCQHSTNNSDTPPPLGLPSMRREGDAKGLTAYPGAGNWNFNPPPAQDKISVPDHEVPPPLGMPKYPKK